MTAYEQGFMDKCAELGINAEALVKTSAGLGAFSRIAGANAGRSLRGMMKAPGQIPWDRIGRAPGIGAGINAVKRFVGPVLGTAVGGELANKLSGGYTNDALRRGVGAVGNKMRNAWNNSSVGKTVNGIAGKANNAVGQARNYMENLGERIGNDYAAYRQRTDTPSKDQQMMAMRQQLGYNNRVLGNYRRAAGVPHTPTQIPPTPKPTLGSVIGAVNPVNLGGGRAVGSLVGRMLGR